MSKAIAYAIAVLILSAAVRLPGLSFPAEVIFDEVHFGKFVTAYCCSHERIFDIHPPHAKLIIAGIARAGGYTGGFEFEHIGQKYPAEIPIVALRLTTALAGMLLPLVIYILLRQLNASPEIALLGGVALAFDNGMVVQSRWISLDTLLLLATFGSLAAFLAGAKLSGKRALGWFVLAGALAGLAVGVKFTGLTALALLGLIILVRFVKELPAFAKASTFAEASADKSAGRRIKNQELRNVITRWIGISALILASAVAVYLVGWALHFALLDQPGSGDAWGLPTDHFWQDLTHTHQQMLSANYGLTATHPDSSRWWEWVLMTKSVFYWSGQNGAAIYMLGNPVVWWGSGVLFVMAFLGIGTRLFKSLTNGRNMSRMTNDQFPMTNMWIPLVGFLLAFLPLARVPRALFLYHYLTPLIFSLLLGLLWFAGNRELRISPPAGGKELSKEVFLIGGLVLLVFLFFSPLTYGFRVPEVWQALLFWLPGWR